MFVAIQVFGMRTTWVSENFYEKMRTIRVANQKMRTVRGTLILGQAAPMTTDPSALYLWSDMAMRTFRGSGQAVQFQRTFAGPLIFSKSYKMP